MHPACFVRRSADRGSTGAGAPEKKAATVARDGVALQEERGAFGQPLAAAGDSNLVDAYCWRGSQHRASLGSGKMQELKNDYHD